MPMKNLCKHVHSSLIPSNQVLGKQPKCLLLSE